MVKKIFLLFFLITFSFCDIYEKECLKCHNKNAPNLKKIFFDYLLVYSSKKRVKKAIFEYLKNPNPKKSIMPKEYIKKYGVKKRVNLDDKKLKKAIDIYWEKYKVIGKIK